MCRLSIPVQREIIGQVLRRVARAEMFTAWDIRQSAMAQFEACGRRVDIPHRDARQAVHCLFFHGAMGPDYVRTASAVGAHGETAFVYHRASDAPGLYCAAQSAARLIG